jgi:phosphoglycolate phosphatase-like HAD superfamily hydrolase
MTITITNKDGLNQISTFSDEKIKHITETNQWGHVIETILRDSNRENMKQTPVEWLEDALFKIHGSSTDMNGTIKFLEKEFKELFVQAKEMEKQQQSYSEEEVIDALRSVELKYNKDFTRIYEGVSEYLKELKNK